MFRFRQYVKMLLQNAVLPLAYRFYSRKPVEKGKVLFADAHHKEIPFSMKRMYDTVRTTEDQNLKIQEFICDFGTLPFYKMPGYLLSFMKAYATAEYVFICDYYLPAAACRKREETTIVQLWHSCGLMKRIAYDASDDIPKNYRGNMFGNYTWLTLSAQACVSVHANALRIPEERIRAVGVSRTDYYFDPVWNETCRKHFYEKYPQARGKQIVLWAPTFRGNAACPVLEGLEEIQSLPEKLPGWYLICKAHPHIDAHKKVSNCDIPTEELLCVADVLITDYSSVLYDYLFYDRPVVLFAPDLEQYQRIRGFYIDYSSMPFPIVQDAASLVQAVKHAKEDQKRYAKQQTEWKENYTGACDGNSSKRILELAGITKKEGKG